MTQEQFNLLDKLISANVDNTFLLVKDIEDIKKSLKEIISKNNEILINQSALNDKINRLLSK